MRQSKQPAVPEAIRLQKRGSEELDEDSAQDSDLTLRDTTQKSTSTTHKRVKTVSSTGTSPSPRPPLTSSESESMSDDGDVTVPMDKAGGKSSFQGEISLDDSRLYVMDDDATSDVDGMEVSTR